MFQICLIDQLAFRSFDHPLLSLVGELPFEKVSVQWSRALVTDVDELWSCLRCIKTGILLNPIAQLISMD